MDSTMVKETTDILKRLSPQNQAYFMTLVRVAEAAENGVKGLAEQPHKPPGIVHKTTRLPVSTYRNGHYLHD